MQTTKEAKPGSLKLGMGKGKFDRVNENEPLRKLRHLRISEIRLIHLNQKVQG
jgi:hypothetical protein